MLFFFLGAVFFVNGGDATGRDATRRDARDTDVIEQQQGALSLQDYKQHRHCSSATLMEEELSLSELNLGTVSVTKAKYSLPTAAKGARYCKCSLEVFAHI